MPHALCLSTWVVMSSIAVAKRSVWEYGDVVETIAFIFDIAIDSRCVFRLLLIRRIGIDCWLALLLLLLSLHGNFRNGL